MKWYRITQTTVGLYNPGDFILKTGKSLQKISKCRSVDIAHLLLTQGIAYFIVHFPTGG